MVTLRIDNLNSDFVLENIPDLISTFSQSYISQILGLILTDVKNFHVRFTQLSIERLSTSSDLWKLVIDHYLSQSGF